MKNLLKWRVPEAKKKILEKMNDISFLKGTINNYLNEEVFMICELDLEFLKER
jgi:hypothetical protein